MLVNGYQSLETSRETSQLGTNGSGMRSFLCDSGELDTFSETWAPLSSTCAFWTRSQLPRGPQLARAWQVWVHLMLAPTPGYGEAEGVAMCLCAQTNRWTWSNKQPCPIPNGPGHLRD